MTRLLQPSPWPLPSGRDYTLRSAVPTRCPAVNPPPVLPHLCHCHLPTKTRSAAGGLLSDMAAPPSPFISAAATHVFKPSSSIKRLTPPPQLTPPRAPPKLLDAARFISSFLGSLLAPSHQDKHHISVIVHQDAPLPSFTSRLFASAGWGGGGEWGRGRGLTAMGAWRDLGHG